MAEERKRELPLPPGTHAYILDSTKGVVKLFVGPTVINQTGQDRPVKFNTKTFQFDECPSLEAALAQNVVVPEGFYAVLTNPAKRKEDGKIVYPAEGQTQSTPDLAIGLKENIPGPVNFALFPGQTCEVRRGHHLRSNEYLRIKIYNEEKARENWGKAVIKVADNTSVDPNAGKETEPKKEETILASSAPSDLTVGKQYNILGTKVAFYIPPTGVSVVPEGDGQDGKPVFVRQAETLEQLEYSILVDEDGNKEFPRGPAVVFPKPTQQFLLARNAKGQPLLDDDGFPLRKHKAIEMNPLQGIHLKMMKEGELTLADGSKRKYQAGQEIFITGKEMPIYYPEEDHQLVRYDGKTIHYAVAVTEGEGKYVLERESGNVKLVKGPTMLLPDPVKETIAYRALSDRESRVWFPGTHGKGSEESLAWNQKLRAEAGSAPTTRSGVVSEGQLRSDAGQIEALLFSNDAGGIGNYSASPGAFAAAATERGAGRARAKSSQMQESRQGKDQHAAMGEVAERKSTYNEPRAIIFASKFRGVPTIKIQPGYAINVVKSDGTRKPVIGPKTVLLEFSETLDILRLSTGKPKNTNLLFETAYLNIHNNKVTDIIEVETSDHVVVSLKLSHNVNFEGDATKWFTIENYVKHLCDHTRSILKGAVRTKTIQDFYLISTAFIRDTLLGVKAQKAAAEDGEVATAGKRPGLFFEENGMRITDVEVLEVTISDNTIAGLLAKSQHDVVRQNIQLSLKEKELQVTMRSQEIERATAESLYETEARRLLLEGKTVQDKLSLNLTLLSSEQKQAEEQSKVDNLRQALENLRFSAEMDRNKASTEFQIYNAKAQQALNIELLDKQVEAIKAQMGAIAPGLIEALNSVSTRETLIQVARSMSFHQMFGADNAVEFLQKTFANTPLQTIIESVVKKSSMALATGTSSNGSHSSIPA